MGKPNETKMCDTRGPFIESPETFRGGRISGDIILFVSSKGDRLKEENFAVILNFIPFTT